MAKPRHAVRAISKQDRAFEARVRLFASLLGWGKPKRYTHFSEQHGWVIWYEAVSGAAVLQINIRGRHEASAYLKNQRLQSGWHEVNLSTAKAVAGEAARLSSSLMAHCFQTAAGRKAYCLRNAKEVAAAAAEQNRVAKLFRKPRL